MKTDTIQTRNRITTCLLALLTFCLVLTGIFFIAPIEAEAAVNDTFTVDNITYKVLTEEEGNYTVQVSGNTLTSETAVVIPSTVSYNSITYTVTGIGASAFRENYDITSLSLPNSVTTIGEYAFYDCTALKNVTIPGSVIEIKDNAFLGCKNLEDVVLSEGVTYIGSGAFRGCTALKSITIPQSVKQIGYMSFYNTGLEEVVVYSTDCVFEISTYGVFMSFADTVYYGVKGSTLEQYCEDRGYTESFVALETPTYDLGGGTASVELPSGYYEVGDEITITAAMWEGITRTGYTMGTVTCNGESVSYVNSRTGIYLSTTHTMTEDGLSFVVNWTANTYTVTFDQDGGTGGSPASATVTYGNTYRLSNPVAPTKEGYRFEGYYLTDRSGRIPVLVQFFNADMTPTRNVWNVADNVTLTAKWTPIVTSISIPTDKQSQTYNAGGEFVPFNITATYGDSSTEEVEVTEAMLTNFSTDTMGTRTATVTYEGKTATFEYTVSGYAYTVEHYQQNIEDDDYTIVSADTETLYGVGTTAAAAKDYTGFTAQTFEQTAIAEDGSTVVKIYYTRNTYTFTYDLDGGTIEGQSVYTLKYKEPVSLNMNVPTKSGYTFVGYLLTIYMDGTEYTGESPFPISDLSLITYITGDLKITTVWAERQVESISIPIASQNQSYVVDGVFVPFNITVTYDNGETESVEVTESMLTDFSTESAVDNATATVTYTEGEVTKTATFTYSVTNGYAYTVKHYKENLEDGGYTLVETDTQTLYGVGTTAAVAKTYTGFTAQAIEQTTIAEDGSTVVEIRYTRNLYTITLHPENGLEDIVINFKYEEITYADLSEILTQNEPEREGYDFLYWAQSKPNYILGGQPPTNVPLPAYPIPVPDNFERWAYYGMCEVDIIEQPVDVIKTYDGETDTLTVDVSQDGNSDFAVVYQWQISTDGATWNDISGATGSAITVSSVSDSAKYRVQITVYEKEVAENRRSTSATSNEVTVAIGKADQTITLSENEFTYSEGLTIDFADYVDGTGDGTLSFEVSDKNGVEFDFANGVVSNITKAGGTFTLTVNKAASDNYNAATETFTVTLNKGAQTLSVSGTPSAPTWKQNFTVSVSGNKGALSYAITSGNATINSSGVITANGAGQVRYSVAAAATDLYEAKTQEFSVTFAKAAGNLAPDYATSKPTNLTICIGHTSDDITLPTGWRFQSKTTLGQVGNVTLTAVFTPSDTANYSAYTENFTIAVTNHTGGTAASCTTAQVCTECGDVLVEALGHNYNEQVDNTVRTTAANCQECNTYWYDCSRCGASAKNDAKATDKWYTSNEAGEHNMSSDWTSENGQHFHKCTVSGCTHTDTKVNCTGGMATCVSPAICSVCQNPYGSVTAHHFYDTSEWGYKGTDGHAHVCEYCGVHDTVVGHTPNVSAATEETAKYCTVCDFVIEQQLNHVHSEGTEWKYDSEYHWHDCVGNDGQVYSKAEHTYDNACDTTCNVCNATRTITHDYSKLEKNDTEHWYVCSVCGSEKANSRTGHSGGTKDCQHKAECATCGQTYGDFGDHAYDTTVWVSVDNEHHAHKCMLCDAYTDETEHFSLDEATYTEDKLCDACGHKMADALGFELNNVVYKILTNEEGNYTVEVYGNTLTEATEVIIPATVNDEGIEYTVVSIGENAFRNNGYITGVYISEGVISIAKSAFESCSELKYANLPESIETLGIGVFCNCAQLSYVNIPSNVKVIEEWTFNGCHVLEGITIPDGVTHIGYRAFYNCSTLTDITVPYSVEVIGNYAFYGCTGLEQMRIHAQKATIGNNSIPTEVGTVYCDGADSTVAEYCAENGISFQTHEGEHVDKDKNHICDYGCSEALGVCEDNNFDHNCDYGCEKTYGEHSDGDDNNHLCDYGCQKIADDGCYDTVVDGKCDECGENIIHDCKDDNKNHECDICGTAIGNHSDSITDKDHLCDYGCGAVMENCVPNADDGDCTTDIICSICGAITTEGAASHIGGNATCTEKAECTVCGKEYGELVPHSHGSEWKNDADEHWNECECGDKANKAAHVDSDSNGACDACGYAMGTTPPPHTHSHGSTWVTDEGEHWNECECGDKANKAAHVDSDSNGACDTCGYAMSVTPPSHTHVHGSTWVTDEGEHWNECECGDKANKAAHADDNGDNKCDTCDYTMPAHDPDTPPVDNPPTDDNEGLGTGAIIGIVVAAVAVVGGGGFAIFWFVIRKKRGF